MQKRRTRVLLGALLLLAFGSAVLGWRWQTRFTTPQIKENTYLGLTTSEYREQLKQPTASHYWPPDDFPLRRYPHRDAIPVLQNLLEDPDPCIREAAVCCLGIQPSLEDPVLPLLIRAANDPHPQVRLAAMQALGRHRRAAIAAASVVLAAMNDDNADICFEAAWAFYHITGQADPVLPILIRNLQANERCQRDAAYMLGKIGPRAAAAVDALVQRLEDQSVPPASKEEFFGIWFNHSDDERRDIIHRAVLEALGDIGPSAKSAVPAICSFLRNPSGFLRVSACVAYWKITGETDPAVEPLIELLETGTDGDKCRSAAALGRVGSAAETAIPALVRALGDADEDVRRDAAIALGCIGPKAQEAIPALVALLKTDNKRFRDDIAKALTAIDIKAADEAGVLPP